MREFSVNIYIMSRRKQLRPFRVQDDDKSIGDKPIAKDLSADINNGSGRNCSSQLHGKRLLYNCVRFYIVRIADN